MILKVSKEIDETLKSTLVTKLKEQIDDFGAVPVQVHWVLTGNQWALFSDFGELLRCGGFDETRDK